MAKLPVLLDFVQLTHEIRRIKRAIELENGVFENDAEHQYQLAMACWFLIEHEGLELDKFKVIAMAMVHDIVEVYAGDVITFAPNDQKANQIVNEKKARKSLKNQWPNFPSMHELIDEYESGKTPESRFVFAMDKLLPAINNYQYGAKAWRKHGITLSRLKENKRDQIRKSNIVNEYYQELLKIFEEHPELFGDEK
jgi:putative hydrolase of HD superfamily